MTMRRWWAAALALAALLVPLLRPATTPAATPSRFTKVRWELETTSSWAGLRLDGARLLVQRTIESSAGSTVEAGGAGFSVRGPSPARAVVDTILEVPAGASPTLVVRKGWRGDATAELTRLEDTGSVPVISVVNTRTVPDYTVSRSVDASALLGAGLDVPLQDDRRLVLAFYYPWFVRGSFDRGMWSDTPAGPYATDVAWEVDAMVNQAADSGVSGFLASWNGSDRDAGRFDLVLSAARRRGGFAVAPLMELTAEKNASFVDLAALQQSLARALARSDDPAFLRVGGRPVVFVYGSWALTSQQWKTVASATAPGQPEPFFVGDGIDPAYGFDGAYRYNPNGLSGSELAAYDQHMRTELRLEHELYPSTPRRLWAATVSPGMDTRTRDPLGGELTRRYDGSRYDTTWQAALPSQPEWVLITSWNEWYEATHIAPGKRTGTRALTQTREWSTAFRGG